MSKKILFFSHPAMGHTNAMLTIAVKLKEMDHKVYFGVPAIEGKFRTKLDKLPGIIKSALSIPNKVGIMV